MAEMRRFGPADLLLLLVVVAVAAGARAGYLMTCADSGRNAGPIRVQEPASRPGPVQGDAELAALVASVKNGGFSAPTPFLPDGKTEEATAHVAPGYPFLLGQVAKLVAEESFPAAIRWGQCGLGALTAAFAYLFARRAFRSLAVGALAGLLVALNPFSIVATATLDDGVLASFALAGCLFLASQAGEKGGPFVSLLLGAALAGTALVRAAFLPFSFAAMIWFLIRSRVLERGWLCALVSFLGFVTALAPWTIRNVQAMGAPLPVVSSIYLHLWIGNNPAADGGPATPGTWAKAPANELKAMPSQEARYARLGRKVTEEAVAEPVKTMNRRLHAFLGFWVGDAWLKKGEVAQETGEGTEAPEWLAERADNALMVALLAMLGLGLVGWRWSYGWRWESFPAALAMFFVPLPYVLSHCEALSGPRLPLDTVLLCYAAFAVAAVLPGGGALLDAEKAGPPAEPA
ncbi:MAG: glycosyltransferase family 39 protein [Gemmataceae bacterium]|nr:glycosyltransferase family 39 protein [Gemmataceae bacterium]